MLAARWWARNALIMPPTDPWRMHANTLPLAALISPTPREFEVWLRHAHAAIGAPSTSVYKAAHDELMMRRPPWFAGLPGAPNQTVHDEQWSKDMRADEMVRLLKSIALDGDVRIAPHQVIQ